MYRQWVTWKHKEKVEIYLTKPSMVGTPFSSSLCRSLSLSLSLSLTWSIVCVCAWKRGRKGEEDEGKRKVRGKGTCGVSEQGVRGDGKKEEKGESEWPYGA